MTASSVEGTGLGAANKPTVGDLSILANGPAIVFTGYFEVTESLIVSPPAPAALVTFPYGLSGGSENYVVMLTTISGGTIHVADMIEDEAGNFTGFGCIAEAECTAMYVVVNVGQRPNI